MGDMGMANTYKRLGEQKFTNRQPILDDAYYERKAERVNRQASRTNWLGRPMERRKRTGANVRREESVETYRGPVNADQYIQNMRRGMRR